ncbi:DNA-binding transcriptional regulator [Bradyrhizobium sp. LHD-71]|uniref:DNA-binding transcriptional regulator n=1 Tax=Bradyrhizobium sp. LHD-71 TaxID=3072141 RepID=UPI00280EA0E4|nr:DNA-binding transcriptional regulator [Bradyrhizobium sp. LHD-71]MDQ8727785.1 DNA-binding transcriptional regulator [Bradyrhizobium sp. LHD-71]
MGSSPIRAVTRAIDLLQALNRRPISTIDELHGQTGIPKPSIVRLLRTFVAKGLVCHAPKHGAYYLTSQVQSLSVGYHSVPKIVEAAAPLLDAMTSQVKWPMAVSVPDGNAVVIRYSTVPRSPLALLHSSINMRLSFVTRALGRAFLAFCEDDEREIILKAVNISSEPEDAFAQNPVAVRRILAETRAQGYATRDPRVRPVSNTIAVPVFEDTRVVATVGLTFISSALTLEGAVGNHLGQVKQIGLEISKRLTRPKPTSEADRGWSNGARIARSGPLST